MKNTGVGEFNDDCLHRNGKYISHIGNIYYNPIQNMHTVQHVHLTVPVYK